LLAPDCFVTDRSNDLIDDAGTKPVHNESYHQRWRHLSGGLKIIPEYLFGCNIWREQE
jgi:hypothetical protein